VDDGERSVVVVTAFSGVDVQAVTANSMMAVSRDAFPVITLLNLYPTSATGVLWSKGDPSPPVAIAHRRAKDVTVRTIATILSVEGRDIFEVASDTSALEALQKGHPLTDHRPLRRASIAAARSG
jgi:hypothetical protein